MEKKNVTLDCVKALEKEQFSVTTTTQRSRVYINTKDVDKACIFMLRKNAKNAKLVINAKNVERVNAELAKVNAEIDKKNAKLAEQNAKLDADKQKKLAEHVKIAFEKTTDASVWDFQILTDAQTVVFIAKAIRTQLEAELAEVKLDAELAELKAKLEKAETEAELAELEKAIKKHEEAKLAEAKLAELKAVFEAQQKKLAEAKAKAEAEAKKQNSKKNSNSKKQNDKK